MITSARAIEAGQPLPELTDEQIIALAEELAAQAGKELEDWARRTAPEGYYFDELAAERAVKFYPRYLRHTKGKWYGKPFELDVWQRAPIRLAYGWKRPDGRRRFKTVFIEVPRKNGKTGLAAGAGIYLAFADGEPGAEVYSFASDKDQAAIAFNEARRMRAQSEVLQRRTLAYRNAMISPKTNSSYKVLSSESGSKDGLNVSGLIGDEIHALKDRDLYEVLHTAQGAREQPLEFLITTAGAGRLTLWHELHEYAEKVWDGTIEDPTFLPVLFSGRKGPSFAARKEVDIDIMDPRIWALANPGLGRTVSLEYLREQAKRARDMPHYRNAFMRLHLNIPTEQVTRWIPMDWWAACSSGPIDESTLKGRPCFVGIDLSTKIDLTAVAYLFPPREGETKWICIWRFFMPKDSVAERVKRDRVPFDRWIEQGFIQATEGTRVDYDAVQTCIEDDATKFDIVDFGFDPHNASQFVNNMTKAGFQMVELRQGWQTLSEPIKELEALVKGHDFDHGNNPVARWMMSNVVVVKDRNDNPLIDKGKSTERIDGISAAINGIHRGLAAVKPTEDLNTALKRRGMAAVG